MKELSDILHAYRQLDANHGGAALATVVNVEGSAYRRPGARMLITSDGRLVGGVSGGCLERDVVQRAGAVMGSGAPVLVRYDTSNDPENGSGYSLGCGGAIEILIESLNTAGGKELMGCLASSRIHCCKIATVISKHHSIFQLGQRLYIDGSDQCHGQIDDQCLLQRTVDSDLSWKGQFDLAGEKASIFIEVLHPPQRLIVFGAGNDAVPLVSFARALGWDVTVVDVGSSPMDLGRSWEVDQVIRCRIEEAPRRVAIDASAAVVVMTHNFSHDAKLMRWLSNLPVRYLGLLGPRHRTDQMLGDLPLTDLHSPVGLDLGAENPEEVALAIVAEITAVLRGRSGNSLSKSSGPIHIHPNPVEEIACPVAAS